MDLALVERYLYPLTPIPTALKTKGRLRKPVACLLCDLYGTLFISGSGDIGSTAEQGHQSSLIDLLLSRYGQQITAASLRKKMHQAIDDEHARLRAEGIDYPEVRIEKIWETLLPDLDPEMQLRLSVEFEMINNPVWPMPGVELLLRTCVQTGIQLGIISNAQFYTPYLFSWLLGGSPESFGFNPALTLYSYQYGQAKPSSKLFDIARLRLGEAGIKPTNVAYIGNDMHKDIFPAHRAGFQTILFAGDKRSLRLGKENPDSSSITPTMVITHLEQLTDTL